MLDDFMVRAALAGLGVALAAAPMGCFVVWRRLAYFGEATAHSAILGVALALAFSLPMVPMILAASLIMAAALPILARRGFAADTSLGVLAHGALATGLVAIALLTDTRIDLEAFLFGDILVVTRTDLAVIWGGGALIFALIIWRWQALLMATVSPELALASGINPRREEAMLVLVLAMTVAVSIKVVGILLITAFLIIPPAAARPLAQSPELMAVFAGVIGVFSALAGLGAAYWLDAPAGPSIVCTAAVIFVLSAASRSMFQRRGY